MRSLLLHQVGFVPFLARSGIILQLLWSNSTSAKFFLELIFVRPLSIMRQSFFLQALESVQAEFLDELALDAKNALILHNLAPLSTRRDISMLGLIHKVVLGLAPHQLSEFIRPATVMHVCRGWAFNFPRHSRQLHDPIDGSCSRIMERSILCLVYSYNCLPQHAVDHKTVKGFQRTLQNAVKSCATDNQHQWPSVLKFGARDQGVSAFQRMFTKDRAT